MKLKFNLSFNSISIEDLVFLLYFLNLVCILVLSVVLGRDISELMFYVLLVGLIILCLFKCSINQLLPPFLLYAGVVVLFSATYLIHPEYKNWFLHDTYGIVPAFLTPVTGIWAFLIIWLSNDNEKIVRNLKLVCFILWIFYLLRYISSVRRGYWIINDVNGEEVHSAYNLEYGYDMLFPTAFFGSYAFINGKKRYYLPFLIGIYAILMGGSRGAILWPIAMFPLMLPFQWHKMASRRRQYILVLFLLLLAVGILFVFYYQAVVSLGVKLLTSLGINSRTISSLLTGSFSNSNGRETIYKTVWGMIKNGGPFGWGVYGDRPVIGRKFRWGYSHNLFLEILVSFGYLGGSVILILLTKGIIDLYRNCTDSFQQVIFITFFVTSFKLVFSNSFWYTGAFWVLLALMLKWRKKKSMQPVLAETAQAVV
ncbi:MAG: O-antigen ligase family protein [Clostridia bacterium]|nr:O-antigen ligase family protein [Clostridia bacterium]